MAFASSRTTARRASNRSDAMPIVTASRNARSARIDPTSIPVGPSCSPGVRSCYQRPMPEPALVAEHREDREGDEDPEIGSESRSWMVGIVNSSRADQVVCAAYRAGTLDRSAAGRGDGHATFVGLTIGADAA